MMNEDSSNNSGTLTPPEQPHEQSQSQDDCGDGDLPLAASFLALAKDCRYLAAATHLILQSFHAAAPDNDNSADAWYASAILYILMVLRRTGRTLGMNITGLAYHRHHDSKQGSFLSRAIWTRSFLGVTTLYLLHRWSRKRAPRNLQQQQQQQQQQQNTSTLRGSERRQLAERRRRAMIQRSQHHEQDEQQQRETDGRETSTTTTTTATRQQRQQRQQRQTQASYTSPSLSSSTFSQIQEHLRQAWQRLLENFMVFQTAGPHDLTAQQLSAAWWCLRLYTAYYCLDARFPSMGHYLLGHGVVAATANNKASHQQQRLVHQPKSHRLVALLILSHTAGVALQQISEWFLQWLVQSLPSNDSGRRLRISNTTTTTKTRSNHHEKPTATGICAICQQSRKNPACPIQCGHVFCWSCLQNWVNHFRAECPVCRKPSRPQDILALYNYQVTPDSAEDS